MDHAKCLDVLTSLPISQSILPRAVCFTTSHPANHVICSFIDSNGYASGPIRRCLFIDYIINGVISLPDATSYDTLCFSAVQNLIACGIESGKIASDYRLYGHRDVVVSTSCPGNTLYALIQKWPHYSHVHP